jgi:hypothetical protein
MAARINFIYLQRKYPGKWVALEEKNKSVVSFGDNAKKVYDQAKKKGVKIPTVFQVPTISGYFIG